MGGLLEENHGEAMNMMSRGLTDLYAICLYIYMWTERKRKRESARERERAREKERERESTIMRMHSK